MRISHVELRLDVVLLTRAKRKHLIEVEFEVGRRNAVVDGEGICGAVTGSLDTVGFILGELGQGRVNIGNSPRGEPGLEVAVLDNGCEFGAAGGRFRHG